MTKSERVLWGGGTPRSFRPLWIAEELNLQYDYKPIGPRTGETQTLEYSQLNRKQKIPFLQDGDVALSESVAICRYLLERYGPGDLLQPADVKTRVKQDEWVCYIYGEIDETSLNVVRRHGDLSAVYGEAPAAVASAKTYAEKHLSIVGQYLSQHPYLVGEQFGLADVLLMSCLDWAGFYGLDVPEVLMTYKEGLSERPAYQRAFALNYPQLAAKQSAS